MNQKKMKVRAKKGTKCPKEGKPREYITDSKTVEVPCTSFNNRLVMDGSLVKQTEAETGNQKPQKGGRK